MRYPPRPATAVSSSGSSPANLAASLVIACTCARISSRAARTPNRTRTPTITSACGDISSRTSSHGKPDGGARGNGALPVAFASAIAPRSRRAAPSPGCFARHDDCDAFRRLAWHSPFVHAHCRRATRASGWNKQRQYGQRFRGRILPMCRASATRSAYAPPWAPSPPPRGPSGVGGGTRIRGRTDASRSASPRPVDLRHHDVRHEHAPLSPSPARTSRQRASRTARLDHGVPRSGAARGSRPAGPHPRPPPAAASPSARRGRVLRGKLSGGSGFATARERNVEHRAGFLGFRSGRCQRRDVQSPA